MFTLVFPHCKNSDKNQLFITWSVTYHVDAMCYILFKAGTNSNAQQTNEGSNI